MPKADEAERRLRDLRARRLLRVPQDQGLRHERAEARADPDEDRLEADARLGEDLDPQSARGQADHLDAALLVQLEQQLAGGRGPQRGRDQRGRRAICSRTPRSTSSAVKNPPRGDAKTRRADRQVDRLPGLPRRRRRHRARRRARAGRSASRSRTSATRPPTSGSSTGCAIRSTTTRPPTCRTCG